MKAEDNAKPKPKRLFMGDFYLRATDRVDEIRLGQIRRGLHGGKKNLTATKIATATNINFRTLHEYFQRRNRIPIKVMDRLMAVMEFDVVDLIKPSDIAEAYERDPRLKVLVGVALKARVRARETKAAAQDNPKKILDTEPLP